MLLLAVCVIMTASIFSGCAKKSDITVNGVKLTGNDKAAEGEVQAALNKDAANSKQGSVDTKVVFKDPKFEVAIRNAISFHYDGDIFQRQLDNITEIDSCEFATNIEGIEHLTNLKTLRMGTDTDFAPLSG